MASQSQTDDDLNLERTQGLPLLGQQGAEPLPGYHLLELLGRGGFGEVWKCEAPGGLLKAIKFVAGNHNGPLAGEDLAAQEWQALQCIKEVRHPFILSTERIEVVQGQLVIVMELADRSLHEVFQEHRALGNVGIPREELLDYLLEAAEALDLLNFQHGLQHLDVKPRNLFVISNHVKVADFGLVNVLREHPLRKSNQDSGVIRLQKAGLTPLYGAPELLQGRLSPQCDQYSLAIVYQELLTGKLPFNGKNVRQLLFQHLQAEPDLSAVPEEERPILAKALAKKPEERFPSCVDLVRSLWRRELVTEGPSDPAGQSSIRKTSRLRRTLCQPPSVGSTVAQPSDLETTPASGSASGGQGATVDLSSYRYLDCQNRSLMGEVWNVQTPEGQQRIAYHLHSPALTNAASQTEAFRLLRSLRVPGLVSFEVAEQGTNRIVLLGPHFERSLRDRLQEVRMAGKPGLDRAELLTLLLPLGESLDELARKHKLHHLALHAGNLFLHDERLLMSEFGWLQLFWQGGPEPLESFNPRYAAPELADNQPCAASDQYSLALLYAELLTGRHPLKSSPGPRGNSTRVRAAPPSGPDLVLLTPHDREVIGRALSREPQRRFESCKEFLEALADTGAAPPTVVPAGTPRSGAWAVKGKVPTTAGARLPTTALHASRTLIQQLFESVRGPTELRTAEGYRYLARRGEWLQHEFGVVVPGSGLEPLLDAFRKQSGAELLGRQATSWTLLVQPARSRWKSLWSKQGTLQVQIDTVNPVPFRVAQVQLTIQPSGCLGEPAQELLESQGVALLESLRSALHALPDYRTEERLNWQQPVLVASVWPKGEAEAPMTAQARDLSPSGLGLLLPQEPPTTQLRVVLPCPATEGDALGQGVAREMIATVRIARLRPLPNGWFEVGATFVW